MEEDSTAIVEEGGNKIFLDKNGIINIAYIGDQTPESVLNTDLKAKVFRDRQEDLGKDVMFLVDMSQVGSLPLASREAAVSAVSGINLARTAMFGGSQVIRTVLKFVVMVLGKSDRIRYFDNKNEAISWLLSEQYDAKPA